MGQLNEAPLILDGGMGTELESRNFNVQHPLWSAKVLHDNPVAVRDVHVAFYEADVAPTEATELIYRAVQLANDARDTVLSQSKNLKENDVDECLLKKQPLHVLRSCGPYGAFLHDGSEYTGTYKNDLTDFMIKEFHRSRLDILARDLSETDVILFETIPSRRESLIIYKLLKEYPSLIGHVWMSFSCRSPDILRCGNSFSSNILDILKMDEKDKVLAGYGINCTEPGVAIDCLRSFSESRKENISQKRSLFVYPNSGEIWDSQKKVFVESRDTLTSSVNAFLDFDIDAIGGCCRIRPQHIKEISLAVQGWKKLNRKKF